MNKKGIIFIIILIFIVFVIIGLSSRQQVPVTQQNIQKQDVAIFSDISGGELTGTFALKDKGYLGDVEIIVSDVGEGAYKTLELDEQSQRIYKKYFKAKVVAYNPGIEREVLLIAMEDNLGNQYEVDNDIEFYLDGVEEFIVANKYVYPQTRREGYLLFPELHKDAVSVRLIFYSQIRNDKIVFDFPRFSTALDEVQVIQQVPPQEPAGGHF